MGRVNTGILLTRSDRSVSLFSPSPQPRHLSPSRCQYPPVAYLIRTSTSFPFCGGDGGVRKVAWVSQIGEASRRAPVVASLGFAPLHSSHTKEIISTHLLLANPPVVEHVRRPEHHDPPGSLVRGGGRRRVDGTYGPVHRETNRSAPHDRYGGLLNIH